MVLLTAQVFPVYEGTAMTPWYQPFSTLHFVLKAVKRIRKLINKGGSLICV